MPMKRAARVRYIARAILTSQDGKHRRYPGDDVPADVIERSPWLVAKGFVEEVTEPAPEPETPAEEAD